MGRTSKITILILPLFQVHAIIPIMRSGVLPAAWPTLALNRSYPMTSWLTTHYAHPQPDTIPWQIYLQQQYKQVVTGIAVGDRVFFYEYKGNRAVKGEPSRPPGAEGIVRVATVS